MPQNARTLLPSARKCGRANGKDTMARPRYQDGSLFIRGKRTKMWVARWREDVIEDNETLRRTQRTVVLGSLTELSRREARALLQKRVSEINQGRHRARPTMTLEKFAREQWQPSALLALKPSSANYYNFQLDKHILPQLGSHRLCDVSRPVIQQFLLDRKWQGYAGSTVHGIRTTLAKVLQAAVELGYLETNPARAIQIGEREPKREKTILSPAQVQTLLQNLAEPCRTVVLRCAHGHADRRDSCTSMEAARFLTSHYRSRRNILRWAIRNAQDEKQSTGDSDECCLARSTYHTQVELRMDTAGRSCFRYTEGNATQSEEPL